MVLDARTSTLGTIWGGGCNMHFCRAKSADKMEHTEDSVVVRDMSVRATLKITPAGTGHGYRPATGTAGARSWHRTEQNRTEV